MFPACRRDVVLPLEAGALVERVARVPAPDRPLDGAGLGVDQVGGPGVAHRGQERAVPEHLDRVDVVGIPREAVGRQRGLGVGQRDVLERIPGEQKLAGLDVVLLDGRIDHDAVVGAAVLGQVHGDVLVSRHPGVVAIDDQLVEGEDPPVLALQRGDRVVVLVDDHVLAAQRLAGTRDVALPPRDGGLAVVGLPAQVGGDHVLGHRMEPHRLRMIVQDQRPALTGHRRLGEVIEARHEDVAGRQAAAGDVRRSARSAGAGSAG